MTRLKAILKRALGAVLILGSAGWYTYDRITLRSDRALVVAPFEDIRAPADGVLTHSLVPYGSVACGSKLGTLQRVAAVDADVRSRSAELEVRRSQVDALRSTIALGEEILSGTSNREALVRDQRSEHLKRLLAQSEATVTAQETVVGSTERAFERAQKLCEAGLMSATECEDLQAKAEVTARELETSRRQLEVNAFLWQSSQKGLDVVQGSASESSFSRQQRNELSLKLAGLRNDLVVTETQVKTLEAALSGTSIALSSPVNAYVWSVFRRSEGYVGRGEPLFRLAECARSYVLAAVTEARYRELAPRMKATIEIENQQYPGEIAQMLGPSDALGTPTHVPYTPILDNSGEKSAFGLVVVHSTELATAFKGSCHIGAHVEVQFERVGLW